MKLVLKLFIFSGLFAQDMPADPHISWMSTEYDLVNGSITIPLSWDMWWGENGDHWKVIENSNIIYETSIISDTPNSQHGETSIVLTSSGQYEYIIELCNGLDDSELCNASNPVIINIIAEGDNDDSDDEEINIDFEKNIIGYYTSWSVYARNYHVSDIPVEKINYLGGDQKLKSTR